MLEEWQITPNAQRLQKRERDTTQEHAGLVLTEVSLYGTRKRDQSHDIFGPHSCGQDSGFTTVPELTCLEPTVTFNFILRLCKISGRA